jgi:hypothetical protein
MSARRCRAGNAEARAEKLVRSRPSVPTVAWRARRRREPWLGCSGPGAPPQASRVDLGGMDLSLDRLLPGLPPRLALFGASFPSIWQQSADCFGTVRYLSTPLFALLAAVGSHRARLGMRRLSATLCLAWRVWTMRASCELHALSSFSLSLSLSLCLSWCSHRARRVVHGRQPQRQVRVPVRHADRGERKPHLHAFRHAISHYISALQSPRRLSRSLRPTPCDTF